MVGSGLFTIVAAMIVAIAQSGFVLSSFAGKTSSDNRTGKLNAEAHRSRRDVIISSAALLSFCLGGSNAVAVNPDMDVNNALAREYTAFPGLYPTIATKIVNGAKKSPYKNKKDVYKVLTSDAEIERLKMYDSSIKILPVNKSLQQFKESQICKYECSNRVSSSYRDQQITEVQQERSVQGSAAPSGGGSLLNIQIQ
mmetsp:Transcript_19161/g.24854  ORF Transcript_19161/g.24854 Transcript_19161/m.24854 type:complete len:197 (+) Transcript_19161:131-721(+)